MEERIENQEIDFESMSGNEKTKFAKKLQALKIKIPFDDEQEDEKLKLETVKDSELAQSVGLGRSKSVFVPKLGNKPNKVAPEARTSVHRDERRVSGFQV